MASSPVVSTPKTAHILASRVGHDRSRHGMTFHGYQQWATKSGPETVKALSVTTRTGATSFTERSDYHVNDDWKTLEMLYCKTGFPPRLSAVPPRSPSDAP